MLESRISAAEACRGTQIKLVAAAVAGNALEFYDFIAYSYFAVYIGKAFFPATSPFMSLLLSVGVFGVGFIFRPLGAVIFGNYADRVGRKPAMLLAIGLITLGTSALALTPSYSSIGIAAPIIVVLCRILQGLALGGEVGPTTAFLIEIAPFGHRGLYAGWQAASQAFAALVSGMIGVALSSLLSAGDLQAWGWRVPFLIGLVLVPLAIYLRRSMPETFVGRALASAAAPEDGIRQHVRLIVLAVLVIMGLSVSTYVSVYMTTYGISVLKLPSKLVFDATVVGGLLALISSLLGGWLCDRYQRHLVMLIPRICLTVVAYPMFLLLIARPTAAVFVLVIGVTSALTGLSGAATFVIICEALPRAIRATGLSIAYAVGVSLFGGMTQFVITWLIQTTGNPTSPAWYVTLTSVIASVAMWKLPQTDDGQYS